MNAIERNRKKGPFWQYHQTNNFNGIRSEPFFNIKYNEMLWLIVKHVSNFDWRSQQSTFIGRGTAPHLTWFYKNRSKFSSLFLYPCHFSFLKTIKYLCLQDGLPLVQFVLPVENVAIRGEPAGCAHKMKETLVGLLLMPREGNGFPLHQEISSVSKTRWKIPSRYFYWLMIEHHSSPTR